MYKWSYSLECSLTKNKFKICNLSTNYYWLACSLFDKNANIEFIIVLMEYEADRLNDSHSVNGL
jgi:hypothetical protein